MIYHIYIYTPLHQLSTYIPHLIEHTVLWGIANGKEYFKSLKYTAENYTYYTCFTINVADEQEFSEFCDCITQPLSKKVIKYEREVLKQELHYPQYTQRLIDRIWKKLFWKNFQYSRVSKSTYSAINKYHSNYYQIDNMIVAERDLVSQEIKASIISYSDSFDISLQWEKERVFTTTHSVIWLFINEMLQKLFDDYLNFSTRYIGWKYHTSEVIAWEFDEYIFLAINTADVVYISQISEDFISAFIINELFCFSNSAYLDIDGSTMLKYGYCIDENSKREIIKRLNEQVVNIKELLMKKN
jgi:hypothetical protein